MLSPNIHPQQCTFETNPSGWSGHRTIGSWRIWCIWWIRVSCTDDVFGCLWDPLRSKMLGEGSFSVCLNMYFWGWRSSYLSEGHHLLLVASKITSYHLKLRKDIWILSRCFSQGFKTSSRWWSNRGGSLSSNEGFDGGKMRALWPIVSMMVLENATIYNSYIYIYVIFVYNIYAFVIRFELLFLGNISCLKIYFLHAVILTWFFPATRPPVLSSTILGIEPV